MSAGDKSTARSDADTLGAGGAIAVVFLSSNSQNRFNLSGYRLSGNQASEGGAVYALFYDDERTHRFSVTGCVFTDNSALTGECSDAHTVTAVLRVGVKMSGRYASKMAATFLRGKVPLTRQVQPVIVHL